MGMLEGPEEPELELRSERRKFVFNDGDGHGKGKRPVRNSEIGLEVKIQDADMTLQ